MNDSGDGGKLEQICGWTTQTVLYEVGFRVALFCVLGLLSFLIVFASGALGGSFEPSLAVLSSGG